MKKILILSMSCNQPYFQGLMACVKDTWAKPLIRGEYRDITWFGYTSCDSHHPKPCIDFRDHMIYVDCDDTLEGAYIKTKKAYEMIKSTGLDFDYVVRTNTSLVINIKKLIERINSVNENTIISNFQPYYMDGKYLFYIATGFFIGMKKDYFDIATSSNDYHIFGKPQMDDVILSRNLYNGIGNFDGACIDSDERLAVYKICPPDFKIPEKYKRIQNYDYYDNNPEIINDRVMVRIRPYYFENKNDRKTKVCEMENFYELYNVLE